MRKSRSRRTVPAGAAHGEPRRASPVQALYQDAVMAARKLKRDHRACYDADHKAFRDTVKKAQSRVFRMKPGPKDDPLISQVAREVALGANVQDIFRREFPHRRLGDDDLYAMAMENFRGKVNAFIRKHPRLKRLRDRRRKSAAKPAQLIAAPDSPPCSPARDSASR